MAPKMKPAPYPICINIKATITPGNSDNDFVLVTAPKKELQYKQAIIVIIKKRI